MNKRYRLLILITRLGGCHYNRFLIMFNEKPEFLKKGYGRLKSPVDRLIYIKNEPIDLPYPQSGMKALSAITMVGTNPQDGGFAVSKKTGSKIPSDNIISKREFEDFGGYVIEVWNYDPILFAQDGRVDDISLLLSLESNPDERIQMGLDEIREKHELPIKYEE